MHLTRIQGSSSPTPADPLGDMGVFWLLTLLFFVPLVFFLGLFACTATNTTKAADLWVAFLALSSCLGDGFRARVSGFSLNPRHGSYDHTYFRTMTNPGPGSSEHIEMETMLNDRHLHVDDDL